MTEVLSANLEKIKNSSVLDTLELQKQGYILLSAHREENIDDEQNFLSLMNAVNRLAEIYDMPVIYSTHPRSKKFIEARGFVFHKNVRNLKPFGFCDYNNLQLNAFCVVSDSGTLPEEAAYFRSFPAVCIRTSTERPEAIDKGNFILGGISEEQVVQSVAMATEMQRNGDLGVPVPDYSDENVSVKVVKIIQSYTGVVNKMVWRKSI
jgi:UDP-N-acetylglucosamine 2-epimerase (non-hydrolysing)